MQIRRSDFADLTYFLEIARHMNFRKAGAELGVSASALSHAMRGLEARLGVRLLNRTSRSVTLTAAGEALQAQIQAPFQTIGQAMEVLNDFREAPRGKIRLSVPNDAADLLLAPVIPVFLERYPDVEIEISVNNRMIDVVGGGFDAGLRYGGSVPEDMIVQKLTSDYAWVVVGAPDYLEAHGEPLHPSDLNRHWCVRLRAGDGSIYRWEFEKDGQEVVVDVPGSLLIDASSIGLAAVRRGHGLIYSWEPAVAHDLATGRLKRVLQDWTPPSPGLHVYYSSRRQVPSALRLLIEVIRELRPLGL
ncbi:hypothetical protein LTR94_024572 [Friedmanniomyces endolithicus]|nr:hypothetical protein LTR94_024572 [Friedmanniomyces endolithicus]